MTDPMDALTGLQTALKAESVSLNPCKLNPKLKVLLDHPNGTPRFTYAHVANRTVQAVALFVLIEPYEGLPCFQIGYAVIEKLRGTGLGTRILQQSIAELTNGLRNTPVKEFYLEALVSKENISSNAIARKLISQSPIECIDEFSKQEAFQYFRRVASDA